MPERGARVVFWLWVVAVFAAPIPVTCRTKNFGGYVSGRVVLDATDGPYEVRKDIIVESESSLIVTPGVELRFAPGVGITVMTDGILEARGTQDRRVVFTSLNHQQLPWSDPRRYAPRWPDVRLVDGDSILEGRLQIFYKERWRSVCTNSKNWTEEALYVTCRQLGFSGGVLHRWFPRNNDSSQLLYEDPGCSGNESSLLDCAKWSQRQLGSGVCDYHSDIGIECDRSLDDRNDIHWRGMRFLNGKSKDRDPVVDKVNRRESLSVLEYVDLWYAGKDERGNATPALDVVGQPPVMRALDVRHSAFDGIRFYGPDDAFTLENSVVAENRGHGVFVNSSVSQITLSGVTVRDNGGDGVHFIRHENFGSALSLCNTANIRDKQIYPVLRSLVQRKEQKYANCKQDFEVAAWTKQVLTVTLLGLRSDFVDPRHASHIEVYDGETDSSRVLASIPIMNNTFPQSITSTRNKMLLKYRAVPGYDATLIIEILANLGRAFDLNVTNCSITNNNGKGITIRDQRSGILVNNSVIAENGHLAGLDINGGSGDIVVNNSFISGNRGDGINITYTGGFIHIDRSSIANNTGRGISFWFNETSNYLAYNHTVHVTRSEVVNNSLYGILLGNQCLSDSLWNISLNSFRNGRDCSIMILSCWSARRGIRQSNVLITHNQFLDSDHLALQASPILHSHLLIEHNEFRGHSRGVIFINGLDDDDFSEVPAKVEVQENYFAQNRGKFIVNIGVLQGLSFQELLFYKNRLENNVVTEPFENLNPRSRVSAVVVVSSRNTSVYRNYFHNADSLYEFGSHVEKHDITLNVTYNYWGINSGSKENVRKVYERIFDQKDRFNLARADFLPYLLLSSDLDTSEFISDVHERDRIIPFLSDQGIGGVISGYQVLPKNTYVVKRDIYVHPRGTLRIEPGTILKFERSIGMMVQGILHSESDNGYTPIVFTISEPSLTTGGKAKLRLSRGNEGLLEVLVDGRWGSVCDYGWDIVDASIACNQMGLVLHPEDWNLEQSQFDHSSGFEPLLSNVRCTLQDTDITNCKSETDFENTCPTKVGLRCYPPSWSGIRLGMSAKECRLRNVVIEFAGLLDYATNSFKAALQIDFNRHLLERLKVRNNTDSGISIMWNEIFDAQSRHLIDSQLQSNRRHGLVVHSQGLHVHHCDLSNNAASGFHYNPMFTRMQQRDFVSWVNLKEGSQIVSVPDDVGKELHIGSGERRYLVFTQTKGFRRFSIKTTSGNNVAVVVLNPFPSASSENMVIYSRLEISDDAIRWDVRNNLTAFPLRSPGYGVLVDYDPGRNPSAQGILYVASVEGQRNKSPYETHPMLHLDSVTIDGCSRGVSSHHYNRDISDNEDHFHRYSNETILITNTRISRSRSEAIFVWTPFWDPMIKNLAEINYTILNSSMKENSKGLLHYSRDIRNSNNLFHWTINNTEIENNEEGGVDVRLPYVWQYSENFTHSFSMHNCTLQGNRNFEFLIEGHFARVNMSHNLFENNFCKHGIISFSGMEKEMLIENNVFTNNSAKHGIQFNLQSHADKFGLVPASFRRNYITNNRDIGTTAKFGYQPTSYAIGIRGVQQVNVTRNFLYNPNLQFELLAGVTTGSVDNKINVGSNWWGTNNSTLIQQRIFDFDDWNGYVIADFDPYLGVADIDGGTVSFDNRNQPLSVSGLLGGRLYHSLRLPHRAEPYTVSSDLTIMPDVVLTIEPGVVMEFYPSVGILALGDIIARGSADRPIVLRPAKVSNAGNFRLRRQATAPRSRLCIDQKCDVERSDGFLEIYNATTEQWVPVCDARFTERNAQVVCHELGHNILNVNMQFGPRLDIGATETGRIRTWPHPLECTGSESVLVECELRLNGYIDNYKCDHEGDFVYINCGPENLVDTGEHWGGVRFSIPDFESRDSPLDRPSINYVLTDSSRLEYVHIHGAGVLHNEKSAAIQMVQREIQMYHVEVMGSASHGIEVIAASGNLYFDELNIEGNMGVGISFLSLAGESSDDLDGSKLGYDPLRSVDMSYGVFGMVDMCDTNKEMRIANRILLYYKYDNHPVDCVKIFSSLHDVKNIGFRLLQFNLFDGAKYAAQPDSIQIYDGDIFNFTSPKLATIGWQTGLENATKFYVSSDSTLSIMLHTIGGSGENGFIAEVVTLPILHADARDSQHNVSYSRITGNGREGIAYRSAGEITPAVTIRHSRVVRNGRKLFGNFTSGSSAVLLDVQNAEGLYFYNNLILGNQGGLLLRVDSRTAVSALTGLIVNNLFTENRNREVLSLQGRKSGAFQSISVMRNYFARNYAAYRDTIVVSQVISNLQENIAYNNTGKHLLDVLGFERMPLSYQTCEKNWFWRNTATDYWDKSTIIASKAGQRFNFNYLVNPDNDFELAAKNRTLMNRKESPINAKMNWWGFNGTAAISGRIKDYYDYEELLEVEYEPYLHDNSSVLSGKCAGGWKKLGDTCFLYVGGVMTFAEAKRFCELDNASMPYVKTKHHQLMAFVREQQLFYEHYSDRVWIQSLDIPPRECAVLINRRVVKRSCDEFFPFLCERDPEITVSTSLWFMEPLTIGFVSMTALALVFVALCVGFWLCKSRQRYREKLERRNSIRASIRSNRSLTGFSELGYKRRLERAFEAEASTKTPTQEIRLNGSVDSVDKTPSRFSGSIDDSFENTLASRTTAHTHNGDYGAFVGGYRQEAQHENATANLIAQPTFDLTYENQCFVDRSASRNSHETSRDWSSSTGSTLDMKRSLEHDAKDGGPPYVSTPSPALTLDSTGGSSAGSHRRAPLETAM